MDHGSRRPGHGRLMVTAVRGVRGSRAAHGCAGEWLEPAGVAVKIWWLNMSEEPLSMVNLSPNWKIISESWSTSNCLIINNGQLTTKQALSAMECHGSPPCSIRLKHRHDSQLVGSPRSLWVQLHTLRSPGWSSRTCWRHCGGSADLHRWLETQRLRWSQATLVCW